MLERWLNAAVLGFIAKEPQSTDGLEEDGPQLIFFHDHLHSWLEQTIRKKLKEGGQGTCHLG